MLRVLVVDDDPYVTVSLGRVLRRVVTMLSARNVTEALEILRAEPIDTLVVDQQLEENETGEHLLAIVKAQFPSVRRVLMSGGSVTDWNQVADAFLQKPFTQADFLTAVEH